MARKFCGHQFLLYRRNHIGTVFTSAKACDPDSGYLSEFDTIPGSRGLI